MRCNIPTSEFKDRYPWQAKLHGKLSGLFSRKSNRFCKCISDNVRPKESGYGSNLYYNSTDLSLKILSYCYGIRIPDMDKVKDYIERHPGINDIVLYAGILASEEFSKNSEITLELYRGTEIYNRYLTISVRQYSYEDDIAERLDEIRDEYEDSLIGQSGWLLLNTDFMPPKE